MTNGSLKELEHMSIITLYENDHLAFNNHHKIVVICDSQLKSLYDFINGFNAIMILKIKLDMDMYYINCKYNNILDITLP